MQKKDEKIVAVSGGFDPIHVGHLRCLQGTAELAKNRRAKVVVLVNFDACLLYFRILLLSFRCFGGAPPARTRGN